MVGSVTPEKLAGEVAAVLLEQTCVTCDFIRDCRGGLASAFRCCQRHLWVEPEHVTTHVCGHWKRRTWPVIRTMSFGRIRTIGI
jgi:hypothetical protein